MCHSSAQARAARRRPGWPPRRGAPRGPTTSSIAQRSSPIIRYNSGAAARRRVRGHTILPRAAAATSDMMQQAAPLLLNASVEASAPTATFVANTRVAGGSHVRRGAPKSLAKFSGTTT